MSCKPDLLRIPINSKAIGSEINIEYMSFISKDTFFVCGGIKNIKGEIYRTTDAGLHWEKVYSCPDKINALCFSKNKLEAIAVGDSSHIQKSYDGGLTWPVKKLGSEQMREWKNDQSSLKRICFWDDIGAIAISSDNREKGNLYFSSNNGENWSDSQSKNGFRDWWIFNNDSIFAVGYGIIAKIEKERLSYKPKLTVLPFDGDYFTGIWFTSRYIGYLSGFDGGIYKTENGGKTWKTIIKKNQVLKKRIHFNDILFISDKIGYVVGENGLCMKTINEGDSWIEVPFASNKSLLGLFYNNGKVYITSEDGVYFEIEE